MLPLFIMTSLVIHEANLEGRDFCVGDLHGKFDMFLHMLENINFDPAKDRMFSCGDLVDRGEKSFECLSLLYEPWFFAVEANHEQMMQEAVENPAISFIWLKNGGFWAAEYLNDIDHVSDRIPQDATVEFAELVEKSKELPRWRTVKLANGKRVHIIHAEPPVLSVPLNDELLQDEEQVSKIVKMRNYNHDEFVLWSRQCFSAFREQPYETEKQKAWWLRTAVSQGMHKTEKSDLGLIISGHTPVTAPAWIGGRLNIDTGAYRKDVAWAGLTCFEINAEKFWHVKETSFASGEDPVFTFWETQPIRISGETIYNAARGIKS
jgi:Calcineurin-like phosphoesterase